MTEEVKSVSDMIRLTADNSLEFMKQVADHVDKLEEGVIQLQKRVAELEAKSGNNTEAQ
jgi:ubiquinone biosynthesis protein UbiJ